MFYVIVQDDAQFYYNPIPFEKASKCLLISSEWLKNPLARRVDISTEENIICMFSHLINIPKINQRAGADNNDRV